jgi:hypothetical protein
VYSTTEVDVAGTYLCHADRDEEQGRAEMNRRRPAASSRDMYDTEGNTNRVYPLFLVQLRRLRSQSTEPLAFRGALKIIGKELTKPDFGAAQ